MHVHYSQILIKAKVNFVVFTFLSSIAIKGARTLFLFLNYILEKLKATKKQLKATKNN